MTFTSIIGTIPGWITSAGVIGLLGLVLRYLNDRRKIMADARKVDKEADRLDAENEDIRIASLERQIDRLDRRVKLLETEVEDCHRDRDLALAAARFLHDRLATVSPGDEAIVKLNEYLKSPPAFALPKDMRAKLDELDGKEPKT